MVSKLKKQAWKLISELVRRGEADWRGYAKCYTCGIVKHWKELQCGHYIHGKLDYDLRNLKPQCARCNSYLSGNLGRYAERLIRENGEEWVKQLRRDAEIKGNHYLTKELNQIIEDLKQKINELPHN